MAGVIALVATVAGCAADIATTQKRLEPHYRLQHPRGQGPFAAIMLVPGCGGISPGRLRTADDLVRGDYAVVFVDYITARGLRTACHGEVRVEEVARDIDAAAAHLRSLPYVRPEGIGIVGWSLGGAGVLTRLAAGEAPPFTAAAIFYPPCTGLRPWKSDIPLLVHLAGHDDIAPPGPCQELIGRVSPGSPVDVRVHAEARHSFDLSDLGPIVPSRAFPGKTAGYHPDAAREAWSQVLALFDRRLRPSR